VSNLRTMKVVHWVNVSESSAAGSVTLSSRTMKVVHWVNVSESPAAGSVTLSSINGCRYCYFWHELTLCVVS